MNNKDKLASKIVNANKSASEEYLLAEIAEVCKMLKMTQDQAKELSKDISDSSFKHTCNALSAALTENELQQIVDFNEQNPGLHERQTKAILGAGDLIKADAMIAVKNFLSAHGIGGLDLFSNES